MVNERRLFDLGARIGELRTRMGWSQEELANRCGLSRKAINQIETNQTWPSWRTIDLLCSSLSITPHQLFCHCPSELSPEMQRLVRALSDLSTDQIGNIAAMFESLKGKP